VCSSDLWNGLIWIIANGFDLLYSSDGVNWNTGSNLGILGPSNIVWNGTMWLMAGNGVDFSLAYSYNGIIWKGVQSSKEVLNTFSCIAWNGSMWIGGGSLGGANINFASSYDGMIWTPISYSINGISDTALNTIVYGDGKWISGITYNSNKIVYSTDGITWTPCVTGNNLFSV
jgi:hypothetical protein